MCSIHEIADITKQRSIPVMGTRDFNMMWERFRTMMHRPPNPNEQCTIEQLAVVQELIRGGACYVDFGMFGASPQRTAKTMR